MLFFIKKIPKPSNNRRPDPGFAAKLEALWKQSFKTADRLAAILAELQ